MNYCSIKHIENLDVDTFVDDYKLFAVFDSAINILFVSNFVANINKFKDIFKHYGMSNNIFFSCKCNKSYAFLKYAAKEGCGIEVASIYELNDALKYTNRIIASGPSKSDEYILKAMDYNSIISVDDIFELEKIISFNKTVDVFLRISDLNDMVSRFGINKNQILDALELIDKSKVNLLGFSFHINNYDLDDRISAIREVVDIIKEYDLDVKYIDIGGGFPTNYCSKKDFLNFLKKNNKSMYFMNKNFDDFYQYYSDIADEQALQYVLSNVIDILDDIEIIIEPGRSLLSNCGITLFKVEYLKTLSNGDNIIVTDGNINALSEQWFNSDYLIEPCLYKKNYDNKLKKPILASVAGNLCLEQDMVTWRKIKFDYLPEPGDFLIYYNTAGYQMDSNESEFHKIPVLKKVVVENTDDQFVVRRDEEYDC